MRRLVDRVRNDCAAVLRGEMAGLQTTMEQSWGVALEELRRDIKAQQSALATRRRKESDERDHLAGALDRLSQAMQTFTLALEAERRERLGQMEVVECLLREMLIAGSVPLPGPARLVGGSIDAHQTGIEPEIDLRGLDAGSNEELTQGTPVEVRSHFHDRWSHGFEIAEVVQDGARRRFRLKRRDDGRVLPLLFEANDIRQRPNPALNAQAQPPVDRRPADPVPTETCL